MAINNDWNVDFVNKVISHIDGTLDFDGVTTGNPPNSGDYVRGCVSGAVGKLLGDYDINGTAQPIADTATGTLTLTDVVNRFQDNEGLKVLDTLRFDNVTGPGFVVGDIIYESLTAGPARIRVDAIEYHYTDADESNDIGTIYGRMLSPTTAFANDDVLKKNSGTGTRTAMANGASDTGDTWVGATVNEPSTATITPPGSDKAFISNFDGGTEAIPRFAKVVNHSTTETKTAVVQTVYGVTATGSLRLVDCATTWTDNEKIYVKKVPYDNLQTGQTFKIGDKIVIKTTSVGSVQATGKIIAVETITSLTGKITLQNETGTITDDDVIYVRTTSDTKVAYVNGPSATTFRDYVADINGSAILNQLETQGGLYSSTISLNIVRDSNALYTYLQDTFDELGALDDDVPMTAQVALQQFTLVNGWKIPDLSFRFLQSGSIQDSDLNNIWTNYQTLGTVEGIGNTVYAATTPLPQFYILQNSAIVTPWWYYGHIDVLVKVKTNTNTRIVKNATGLLISSGTVTIFNRNFGDTYDHFETTTIAGVAPVPLATANDLNNTSGTHRLLLTGSTQFTVGEEITVSTDATKRGIITALTKGASSGTLDYILTGSTNFATTNIVTGSTSGVTSTVNGAPSSLVAGYGTKIVIATVEGTITYSARSSATNYPGEQVTGVTSGASAILMYDDGTSTLTLGNKTERTNFTNGERLNAASSATRWTLSSTLTVTTRILRDIGDGNGNQPYNAVIFLNRAGTGGDTLARMYEWVKYRTRSLETAGEPAYSLLGGKGSESGVQGRFYITLDTSYALVKASPWGTFAGGTFFGARGVFIQDMANADIRSYQLIDSNGTVRNPPNQQTLTVSGVVSGDRVAVFRTSGGQIYTNEWQISTRSGLYNGSGDTKILVRAGSRSFSSGALPQDVPATGVLRVLDPADTGLFNSYTYSAVNRTSHVFTLSSALGVNLVTGDPAFVVFIQEEATATSVSNNVIYVANISLLARVRSKGILPFEVTGTFTSAGATLSAIRTFDSIVN